MKVTICIGSSCHLKGSREVVEGLQKLVTDNKLEEKIDLGGAFCMGNCQNGVSVKVEDEVFSVTPDSVEEFFTKNILPRV